MISPLRIQTCEKAEEIKKLVKTMGVEGGDIWVTAAYRQLYDLACDIQQLNYTEHLEEPENDKNIIRS